MADISADNTVMENKRRKHMEKTIQQLNLSDDFLFAKVMADSEICRRVLEKILTVP